MSRSTSFRLTLVLALGTVPMTALADEQSEKAAADLLEKRLATERPEDLVILRAAKDKDVVVVLGTMDHIEQVLVAARIRHTTVQPEQVASLDLNANQILMVNCPGNIPEAGVRKIERFVRAGGMLYTTDWALLNLVQKAFPGTIRHNGGSTGSHVTAVKVHKHDDNLMSNMLLRKNSEPEWWLEGSSYPIQIVGQKRVEVLASSPEMGKIYGAAPVVVRFRWDDGEVVHVVSHFYRQIATRGPAVASKDSVGEFQGLTPAQKEEFKTSAGAGVKTGDVESSYAFQRMTSNLVVGKQRANEDLDKSYGHAATKTVHIDGREVGKGERLKVLSRTAGRVRVRDDRGNEADVEADAVMVR